MCGSYKIWIILILSGISACKNHSYPDLPAETFSDVVVPDSIEVLIPTFRGNQERNYYGTGRIDRLEVIWKFWLGKGMTTISRKTGKKEWAGAGWTGQPLLVKVKDDTFLIQGAYDHHLRKIDISNGKEMWKFDFGDVVKGTGTLWRNPYSDHPDSSFLIFQGSRMGEDHFLDSEHIPSFRAISFYSGKELWKYDVPLTASYSRDTDGSAIVWRDTLYIGLENGWFALFNPDPSKAVFTDSMVQPQLYSKHVLYNKKDIKLHGGNLVTESSPAVLKDRIYIASGSGHVYGYNMDKGFMDWDFYIGSDIDGSVVVTGDSCLLVSVEKQYIKGSGGLFKLDPSRPPDSCVIWFQPTGNIPYAGWEGGIIGTAAINDRYTGDSLPKLAVATGIDGYTYIVRHDSTLRKSRSAGPDGKKRYHLPFSVKKLRTGPSISSPVITADRLLVPGYNGLFLYAYDKNLNFTLLDYKPGCFEAAPILYGRSAYIADRSGFLYRLGELSAK